MADTNYPTYQVGGKTYYRINPQVPEFEEKAWTWALDKAANYFAPDMAQDPTNGMATKARLYKQVVLDRNMRPITERDMGRDVMQGAAQAAMRGLADGRQNIDYGDYGSDVRDSFENPAREVFGGARLTRPTNGGVTVRDTWDFNASKELDNQPDRAMERVYADAASNGPSWLARRAVPDGTGPQVNVNISPRGMLQAKDTLYGRTAPAMLGSSLNTEQRIAPISRPMGAGTSFGMAPRKSFTGASYSAQPYHW